MCVCVCVWVKVAVGVWVCVCVGICQQCKKEEQEKLEKSHAKPNAEFSPRTHSLN